MLLLCALSRLVPRKLTRFLSGFFVQLHFLWFLSGVSSIRFLGTLSCFPYFLPLLLLDFLARDL